MRSKDVRFVMIGLEKEQRLLHGFARILWQRRDRRHPSIQIGTGLETSIEFTSACGKLSSGRVAHRSDPIQIKPACKCKLFPVAGVQLRQAIEHKANIFCSYLDSESSLIHHALKLLCWRESGWSSIAVWRYEPTIGEDNHVGNLGMLDGRNYIAVADHILN